MLVRHNANDKLPVPLRGNALIITLEAFPTLRFRAISLVVSRAFEELETQTLFPVKPLIVQVASFEQVSVA